MVMARSGRGWTCEIPWWAYTEDPQVEGSVTKQRSSSAKLTVHCHFGCSCRTGQASIRKSPLTTQLFHQLAVSDLEQVTFPTWASVSSSTLWFHGKNEKWLAGPRLNQGTFWGYRPRWDKRDWKRRISFEVFSFLIPAGSHSGCSLRLQPDLSSSFSREGTMGTMQEISPLLSQRDVLAHAIDLRTPFRCIIK